MTSTRQPRFSLIELILVMVVLVATAAMIAPRLTGFFRGRDVAHEARRLWALTGYAREQAVTRGVPVELAFDTEARTATVAAVPGFGFDVPARSFFLGRELDIVVDTPSDDSPLAVRWWADGTLMADSATAIVVRDAAQPTDAWTIARQGVLSRFTLEQGAPE